MAKKIIELNDDQNDCLIVLIEWTLDDASYGEDLASVIYDLLLGNDWDPNPSDYGLEPA